MKNENIPLTMKLEEPKDLKERKKLEWSKRKGIEEMGRKEWSKEMEQKRNNKPIKKE